MYPLLLAAAAAASAAGTGMSIAGNQEAADAMQSVRNNELLQQQGFQRQANSVFQNSVAQANPTNVNAEMAKGAANRQGLAQALAAGAMPVAQPLPATSTAATPENDSPNPMDRAQANQQARTNAWTGLVQHAQAKLGAYSDLSTQQGIQNAQAAGNLAVINNKAQGQANLLPIELQVASQKGNSLSGWGQMVSALGSIGMMAGATGLGAAGAANTATSQGTEGINFGASVPGGLAVPQDELVDSADLPGWGPVTASQ